MGEPSGSFANSGSDSTALTVAAGAPAYQDTALLASTITRSPNLPAGTWLSAASSAVYSPEVLTNGGQITTEIWIKPTPSSLSGQIFLVTKGIGTHYEYSMYLSNGNLNFSTYTAAGVNIVTVTGATTLTSGAVYHLVATYNANTPTSSVFVNGAVDGTSTVFSGVAIAGPAVVGVAGRADTTTIDNLSGVGGWSAIYSTALSSTRVLAHYTAGAVAATVAAFFGAPHRPVFNPTGIRKGRQFQYLNPIVFGSFIPGTGTKAGHPPIFNPSGIRRGRSNQRFLYISPPAASSFFFPFRPQKPRSVPPLKRGKSYQHFGVTPASGAGFPQALRSPSSRLGLGGTPFRRGITKSAPFAGGVDLGPGFAQFLRNPSSRFGLGSAPSRRGKYSTSPYMQSGTTGTGVVLYSDSGINPGVQIAFVIIEVKPPGSGVLSTNGFPFYPSPEIVQVNEDGNWLAWAQTVAAFTSPYTHYLVTEYNTDGHSARSYKVRIPAGTSGAVNIKDVMV